MKDFRFGEPVPGELVDPLPGCLVLLAVSPQRAPPQSMTRPAELAQRRQFVGTA